MFTPEWQGPIEGYVVNYLTKHHWKIARTIPRDDALQEAYCIFLRCKRKYPEVTEGAHFMALFKTAWYRHFTDLANEDTEARESLVPITNLNGETYDPVGALDNDGLLAVMIEQAPREVTMVLTLFLNAPQELLDVALTGWRSQGDKRFKGGGSKQINKLLGLPEEYDSMKAVTEYFGG